MASSITSILLCRRRALARHTSCLSPMLKFEPPSDTSVSRPLANLANVSCSSTLNDKLCKKGKCVNVGNDQEMVQSKRNSHTKKIEVKKKTLNGQSGTYTCTKATYCKPTEQLLPNRRP